MQEIGAALVGPYSARVALSSNQLITNGVATAISFNATSFNNGSLYAGGNPTRLTAPVAGRYLVRGFVKFAPSAIGNVRRAEILKNGLNPSITFVDRAPDAAGAADVEVVEIVSLAAGDYLELWTYHDGGAPLNVQGLAGLYYTSFSMALLVGQ